MSRFKPNKDASRENIDTVVKLVKKKTGLDLETITPEQLSANAKKIRDATADIADDNEDHFHAVFHIVHALDDLLKSPSKVKESTSEFPRLQMLTESKKDVLAALKGMTPKERKYICDRLCKMVEADEA